MVFLYAVGVLTIVLTVGLSAGAVGKPSADLQMRAQLQDQAKYASSSGILYGRKYVRDMVYRCNGETPPAICPGIDQALAAQWRGEPWTGAADPSVHSAWAARTGVPSLFHLATIYTGLRAADQVANHTKARVYFFLNLDETLARNGYLFLGEDQFGGRVDCCTPAAPPAYEADNILYSMRSTGLVYVPNPASVGTPNTDRLMAELTSRLTFSIPIEFDVIDFGGVPIDVITRSYSDRALEFENR